MQHRGGICQAVQDQTISLSSDVKVSSSTSQLFKMVKIVFVPNPARASCRKIRAVAFWSLGFTVRLRRRYSRACFSSLTPSKAASTAFSITSRVHALYFQIGDHTSSPKFLIVPAQRRKIGRILRIVQVSAILQPPDHQLNQRLPILRFCIFHPRAK